VVGSRLEQLPIAVVVDALGGLVYHSVNGGVCRPKKRDVLDGGYEPCRLVWDTLPSRSRCRCETSEYRERTEQRVCLPAK